MGERKGFEIAGRGPVWAALWTGVVASFLLQVSTAAHLKLGFRDLGWSGGARPPLHEALSTATALLRPADWAALASGGAALLALALLEVRGRRVTALLRDALRRPGTALGFLAVVAALTVRPYFDAGVPHAFDAKLNWTRVFVTAEMFEAGEWPSWSWRWYCGYPFLRFYGPLFFLPAGALELLLPGDAAGLKVLLALLHLATAALAWKLVQRLSGSHAASLVAATTSLLCFQRFHTLLRLGRLPEALLPPLFLLLLFCLERLRERPAMRTAVGAGLAGGALLLAHPALGLIGGGVAAVAFLARCAMLPRGPLPAGRCAVAALSAAGLALAATAFWWVPAVSEGPLTLAGATPGGVASLLLPPPAFPAEATRLLLWGAPWSAESAVAYAGLSVLLLAAVGLASLLRHDLPLGLPLLLAISLTVLYLGGGYFQTRSVVFLGPLLAVAAGCAWPSFANRRPGTLPVLGLALVLLDLLPLTVHSTNRPDLTPLTEDLRRASASFRGSKVALVSMRTASPSVSQWAGWDTAGLHHLAGPHREGAPGTYSLCLTLLDRVGRDLAAGAVLPPDTVRALRLSGVKAILFEDGSRLVPPPVPAGPGTALGTDPPALLVEGAEPLLFCRTAAEFDGPLPERSLTDLPEDDELSRRWRAALGRLVTFSRPDLRRASAGRVPLLGSGPAPSPPTEGAPEPLRGLRVLEDRHRVVRYAFEAPAPGWLLLPFSSYPGVRVVLDGETVEARPTALGTLAVEIGPGAHRLALIGPAPSLADPEVLVSLAALALALAALLPGLFRSTRP